MVPCALSFYSVLDCIVCNWSIAMVQGWWIPADKKAGGGESFTLNVDGSGTWSYKKKKINKQCWLKAISQTFQEKKTYLRGLDIVN